MDATEATDGMEEAEVMEEASPDLTETEAVEEVTEEAVDEPVTEEADI